MIGIQNKISNNETITGNAFIKLSYAADKNSKIIERGMRCLFFVFNLMGFKTYLFLQEVLGSFFFSESLRLAWKSFSNNGGFFVEFVQFDNIEFRLLDGFNFSDDDIVNWVDELASLSNLLTDVFSDELSDEVSKVAGVGFLGHNLDHLLSDLLNLRHLSVRSLLKLLLGNSGSEGDAEKFKNVTILSLDLNVSLNNVLPFSDELAELVSGDVHTVEVGHAVSTLDVLNRELHLSPGKLLRFVVKISQRDLNDSTFKSVTCDFCAGSSGAKGLAEKSLVERDWSLKVVPFLLAHWVDDLLLSSLTLLGDSLVLTNCHFLTFFYSD